MSQALEVYLVPDKRHLKIFGCRRRKLLAEVLEQAAEALEDLDEQFDVEDEDQITHAQALKEIFAGKLTREEDCGFIYGHAYEIYCSSMGEMLSNNHFSPTCVEWLNTLDGFFTKQDVPLRFHQLLFEEFPIPVETDATPCGGFWDHPEIVEARKPLKAAIAGAADADIAKAASVVLGWVNKAIKTPGSVIVGFFD